MKRDGVTFKWVAIAVFFVCTCSAETLLLKAKKDTFARTQDRRNNNGASSTLLLAHNASVRSLVSFDLSGVTNEIEKAVFRIRKKNTMPTPIAVTVAPMAATPANAAWNEGRGAQGAYGRIANRGESNWAFSAFPDIKWQGEDERDVIDLMSDRLWKPALLHETPIQWTEGEWLEVPLIKTTWLEQLRTSQEALLTLGIWGTSGDGIYEMNARESAWAPQLKLTLNTKEQP